MNSEDSAQPKGFPGAGEQFLLENWRLLLASEPFKTLLAGLAPQGAGDPQRASDILQEHFETLLRQLQQQPQALTSLFEALSGMTGQLGTLQGLCSAYGAASAVGLPQLGPLQQRQERLAAAAELAQEYLAAQQGYLDQLGQLASQTLAAGNQRLNDAAADSDLDSLYYAWLQAAETAYEEALGSPGYAKALGRFSNASAALVRHLQQDLDELLGLLDLPTRADLRSTQQRLHEIRRRQHAVAEAIDDAELQQLKDEVRSLRRELDALKRTRQRQGSKGHP